MSNEAKNLIIRGLSKEANEGLEWGKRHFGVGTNSTAGENMIANYPTLHATLNDVVRERDNLRRIIDELTMKVSARIEAEREIQAFIDEFKL